MNFTNNLVSNLLRDVKRCSFGACFRLIKNMMLNISGLSGVPKCEKCLYCACGHKFIAHMNILRACGIVGTLKSDHMNASCSHGNDYMGTWEQYGNVGTTYGKDNMGWQANIIARYRGNYTVFHVGLLNTHRVHLFLVLHIELEISTWSSIYNTSHWIGQQTFKKILSLSLRSSQVHHVDNIGTISM